MNFLSRSVTFSVLGIAATLAPVSGFAYLAPEQVFGGQSATFQPAPPLQRESDAVIQQQQTRAAERRAADQSGLTSVDAAPVDTYVPEDSSKPRGLLDEGATYDRRQQRIQNEKSSGPTIIIGGDSTVRDSNGNVLHSGAPRVTSTGPESILALAAMILAALTTFVYAQIRARRMTVLA